MTSMIDIYEAMGGVVNEDRTSVQIASPGKPFKIELLVMPNTFEMGADGEFVTFAVLVDDGHIIEEGPLGVNVRNVYHDIDLRLPVESVNIKKD